MKYFVLTLFLSTGCASLKGKSSGSVDSWKEASDLVAIQYLTEMAAIHPEVGSEIGLADFDSQGMLLNEGSEAADISFSKSWIADLDKKLGAGLDPRLRYDFQILRSWIAERLQLVEERAKANRIDLQHGERVVYLGLQTLFMAPSTSRGRAAVDRFKVYVYGDSQHRPLLVAMQDVTKAQIKQLDGKKIVWPAKDEVEQYLKSADDYARGIREMLKASGREDWSYDLIAFESQMRSYRSFVRRTILPKATPAVPMTNEQYVKTLRGFGIEMAPSEILAKSQALYSTLYTEFKKQAEELAKKHSLSAREPKTVVRELKRNSAVSASEALEIYTTEAKRIQQIIEKNNLVSVPIEPLLIRMATDMETQEIPAPQLVPPLLLNNQGAQPNFVIPDGSTVPAFDDLSTRHLVAGFLSHEGRPGHDLQFRQFLAVGVSLIRSRFALTNFNLEGWAQYSEDLIYPYLELEEQFFVNQVRLWRIARAAQEVKLQQRKSDAKAIAKQFTEDLGLTEAWAKMDIQRLQGGEFGQSTRYFVSHQLIKDMHTAVESKMGPKFTSKCFADQFLSYGLVPLELIQKNIVNDIKCN